MGVFVILVIATLLKSVAVPSHPVTFSGADEGVADFLTVGAGVGEDAEELKNAILSAVRCICAVVDDLELSELEVELVEDKESNGSSSVKSAVTDVSREKLPGAEPTDVDTKNCFSSFLLRGIDTGAALLFFYKDNERTDLLEELLEVPPVTAFALVVIFDTGVSLAIDNDASLVVWAFELA